MAKRIVAGLAALLFVSGTAFAKTDPQTGEKHHSKLKGAVVGGAAGAVVGGKKGAAVGAGAGALYQHHKNKKAEKAARKSQ